MGWAGDGATAGASLGDAPEVEAIWTPWRWPFLRADPVSLAAIAGVAGAPGALAKDGAAEEGGGAALVGDGSGAAAGAGGDGVGIEGGDDSAAASGGATSA